MSEQYFTFPLAVLHGDGPEPSPRSCIDLAVDFGTHGAGRGYRHHHGNDDFEDKLEEICEEKEIKKQARPAAHTPAAEVLVGAGICGVKLGSYRRDNLASIAARASRVPTGGALVRMKSTFLWAALYQARAEDDPEKSWPEHGISWREFRILAAILSAKTNRAGFSFIGWQSIQHRACGFTSKAAFDKADVIPDHLAPPLTRKVIRSTCNALEALGFFSRFHLSTSKVGGKMAYSFRHNRDELAKAVCDLTNFQDRAKIKTFRADDAEKCLQLLERAKSGTSEGQGGAK